MRGEAKSGTPGAGKQLAIDASKSILETRDGGSMNSDLLGESEGDPPFLSLPVLVEGELLACTSA
jgi:hypothetical protein